MVNDISTIKVDVCKKDRNEEGCKVKEIIYEVENDKRMVIVVLKVNEV